MPPQRGKSQPANPEGAYLGYGDTVTVLVVPWRDPRSGQVGTVKRVRLRGADLWVTVEFSDAERRDYFEDEIQRVRGQRP